MQNPPNNKSLYIHTLIFGKNNGIDSTYAYFPDSKVLLGYIQYSFLQEAFYKWIYGKNRMVTKIPSYPVDKIISDGLAKNNITKEEANKMLSYYTRLSKMWDVPKDRLLTELIKFSRDFNKAWVGDNKEFLYLKIFKSSKELGRFVLDTTMITAEEDEFQNKTGVTPNEWIEICELASNNKNFGEKLKLIMQKKLTEIL